MTPYRWATISAECTTFVAALETVRPLAPASMAPSLPTAAPSAFVALAHNSHRVVALAGDLLLPAPLYGNISYQTRQARAITCRVAHAVKEARKVESVRAGGLGQGVAHHSLVDRERPAGEPRGIPSVASQYCFLAGDRMCSGTWHKVTLVFSCSNNQSKPSR